MAPSDEAEGETTGPEGPEPLDRLLDLCVFAPLGLALDARRVVPELAQQGRAQARMARMVGEFAVGWGNQRLQSTLADAQDQAVELLRRLGIASPEPQQSAGAPDSGDDDHWPGEGYAPEAAGEAATAGYEGPAWREQAESEAPPAGYDGPAWLEEAPATDDEGVAELAIPDYDNLSASQVVPRLDGLTSVELEAVQAYERANRHRKTILSRIAQLQAGSD